MSRLSALTASCVFVLAAASVTSAEEPKQNKDSPDDVARRAMTAFKENRLDDFAKEMHPAALKQIKEWLMAVLKAAEEDGSEKGFLRLFKGVRSIDDAAKLDDKQFFVSFLKGIIDLKPEMKEAIAGAKMECVGHVMEGQDTAHVVMRMRLTVSGVEVTKLDVITLTRTDSGWGMQLNGDMDAIVQALKQKFSKKK